MADEKRLVDADKLMERFRIVAQSGGPVVYHVSDICATIEDEAAEEPVDAAPVVHGRWVDRYCGRYDNPLYECSECKEKATYTALYDQVLSDYCPNCGAKMDGERKDDEN